MSRLAPAAKTKQAIRFVLNGRVQGLGVRPAIARLATHLGLTGTVSNRSDGVRVHVEGDPAALNTFEVRLASALPAAVDVQHLSRTEVEFLECDAFVIESGTGRRAIATEVPCDRPVCEDCLSEVFGDVDRRHRYAFTSCTNCGPRYSIIERMPYEREGTAMRDFALCHCCRDEFTTSNDRRFHAQTNACPDCGPSLRAVDSYRNVVATGSTAVELAATTLFNGGIVALKGLGGYQLVCDASQTAAVERLRLRKRRPAKPLAVMIDATVAELFTDDDHMAFTEAANPIVVLSPESAARLRENIDLSPLLAPGMNTLGVFRPTTPLHALLIEATGRPLVVTSGNVDGESLAFDAAVAARELAPLVDLMVQHDRRIVRPIDDSVVHVIAGHSVTIRAARGLAPLTTWRTLPVCDDRNGLPNACRDREIEPEACPTLLAVGGHQKVAVALCNGRQNVLGPHIGDLDSLATRERYVEQTSELLDLYQAEPQAIVCDLHPDYFSTRFAEQQADVRGVPLIRVQHHHAHVAAGMVEHGWLDQTVLGVAFDGTGYGTDGTIWGGEFLLSSATGFERVASLRPFVLPGGEAAIREPWRVTVSLLTQALDDDTQLALVNSTKSPDVVAATRNLARQRVGPLCSSVGRLFDGVAAIILGIGEALFEGEPAMRLEAACDPGEAGAYDLPIDDSADLFQLDWRPLIRELCKDRQRNAPAGRMAMKFHRGLTAAVESIVGKYADVPVVLGGGCFQNRVLTELTAERLGVRTQPVGLPGIIPPNDGGLAAGQLAIGLARLKQSARTGIEQRTSRHATERRPEGSPSCDFGPQERAPCA
ncbi:MAG: carbamoyltransferase HypF [Planctomycetota bacterium]|nr:MAG: carbamoyltransferase HypF [Planctomycetota bacterium]REJ96756.1 MAG: carbamoyltransferase HypF [Planctomycetota bacterium]REK25166.1 MAG: carbamoyltransferase HypF [Planctomycetota bacterium]REK38807.1 MAG: carbamoyltransferase HypF [Planctomycetota bacterium]